MHSLVAQLSMLQLELQQLPRCVQRQQSSRQLPTAVARYHSKDLDQLYHQAQRPPQITNLDVLLQPQVPATPEQQQHHQTQQKQQHICTAGPLLDRGLQHTVPHASGPAVSPAQQPGPLPDSRLRPSRMDFAAMYAQLQAWQQRHLSAHVPRHCFDAPQLGAWVRFMRKQHTDGHLVQWKVDSLNALGFEWELTNQQAKWHHLYHQLRRHRALYGTTDIDVTRSSEDGCDWALVAWWLRKQAKLLAKQKLGSQQRAMLEQLGVRLTVPKQLVQRTAQLQALNGTERRQLRKKWKLQDNLKHQAQRQQRQQQLRELLQQRQQQRGVEQRRQRLLQQAAAASVDQTAGKAGGQRVAGDEQAQRGFVDIAVQQLHAVQQLSSHNRQQHAPPLQQRRSMSAATVTQQQQRPWRQPKRQQPVLLFGQPATATDAAVQGDQVAAMGAGTETAPQLQPDLQHAEQPQQHLAQPPQQQQQQQQQQESEHALVVPTDLPAQDGIGVQQQQQQQGRVLKAEAGALLFQPNRRRNKVKKRSRHEKWLAAADDN